MMAVLKVKNGDEWIPVVGSGGTSSISGSLVYNMKTNTLISSTNVKQVSDEGTGLLKVTFDTPFADDTYCVVSDSNCGNGNGTPISDLAMVISTADILSASETMLRGWTTDTTGRPYDAPRMTALWYAKEGI
jgi:hypothetical protein